MTYDSGCSYRKQSKLHVKACLWRSKMRPEQVEVTPIEGDRVFYSRTCTIPCQNFVLWCISCWCNVLACVSLSWKVQVGTLHHLLVFPKNKKLCERCLCGAGIMQGVLLILVFITYTKKETQLRSHKPTILFQVFQPNINYLPSHWVESNFVVYSFTDKFVGVQVKG
jgi:hypothetical protein